MNCGIYILTNNMCNPHDGEYREQIESLTIEELAYTLEQVYWKLSPIPHNLYSLGYKAVQETKRLAVLGQIPNDDSDKE